MIEAPVSGAFHTEYMRPALDRFEDALSKIDFSEPRIPIYSNVTGLPYESVDDMKSLLVRQIVEPVLWRATMLHLVAKGPGHMRFYEVGPGKQLKTMLSKVNRKLIRNIVNIEV